MIMLALGSHLVSHRRFIPTKGRTDRSSRGGPVDVMAPATGNNPHKLTSLRTDCRSSRDIGGVY